MFCMEKIEMMRRLLLPTALLVASPAFAQETAPAAGAQPSPTAPAQSTPAAGADSVAAIVESEYPAYDANSNGQLDQAEFSRWMVALKNQELKTTGKTLAPDEVVTWANGAFTTADGDKSASVSKTELIAYLSAGAK